MANVLRTLVSGNRLAASDGRAALDVFLEAPISLHGPTDDLMRGAFDFALGLGHPIQDCLYLALAVDLDAHS